MWYGSFFLLFSDTQQCIISEHSQWKYNAFFLWEMKMHLGAVSNKAESFVTAGYWLINYRDTKAKCRSSKKIYL